MALKTFASSLVLVSAVSAAILPRTVTEPPASACTYRNSISIRYSIDTSVTDPTSWYSSINFMYYTEGWTWIGSRVPIYTYAPSPTATDDGKPPPSPTGSMWSWPPYPPSEAPGSAGDEKTGAGAEPKGCTPHGDHWHCPERVEETLYAPGEAPGSEAIPELRTTAADRTEITGIVPRALKSPRPLLLRLPPPTLVTAKEPVISSKPEEPVPAVVVSGGSKLAEPPTCMALAVAFFFGVLMA
ncbi:hypothetical protein CDV31_005004 [Fusarium ambrosium]|uniref:Uncharacterized protein n=1 Tax=Fusarium ambrosium TaxID=131363 RepID=A0A428UMA3_9HYPO|nr:hypothetical protein CDV31_005004 [Fusarium ambrosium]